MSSDILSAVVILLIIIALCGVVIVFAPKLERLVNKRSEKLSKKEESDAFAGFVVGRIYQMEDGSFAKYVGKGKFVKVKEQD